MSVRQDEPFEIQPRANGAMARALQAATIAALVLGLLGTLAPGRTGALAASAAVVIVIAAPLCRIVWLGVRWVQRGDTRFALLAFGLLGVVLLGAGLATLQG